MPFTTQEARRVTDLVGPQVVGDRCFIHYRNMMTRWAKSPRWTTAHEIYRGVMEARRDTPLGDDLAALDLAWQVFFALEVIPYEEKMRIKNGDVQPKCL